MKLRGWFVGIGCVVMTGVLAAQAAPSLAGSWELDREKTQAANAANAGSAGGGTGGSGATRMGGGGGGTLSGGGVGGTISGGGNAAPLPWTITQTPAAVTMVRSLPDGLEQKYVYKLDGESVNTNARTTLTTKSRWESGKLITEGTQVTTTEGGAVSGTFKETRWLASDGSMHVETTRSINGNAPTTSVSVLSRSRK